MNGDSVSAAGGGSVLDAILERGPRRRDRGRSGRARRAAASGCRGTRLRRRAAADARSIAAAAPVRVTAKRCSHRSKLRLNVCRLRVIGGALRPCRAPSARSRRAPIGRPCRCSATDAFDEAQPGAAHVQHVSGRAHGQGLRAASRGDDRARQRHERDPPARDGPRGLKTGPPS